MTTETKATAPAAEPTKDDAAKAKADAKAKDDAAKAKADAKAKDDPKAKAPKVGQDVTVRMMRPGPTRIEATCPVVKVHSDDLVDVEVRTPSGKRFVLERVPRRDHLDKAESGRKLPTPRFWLKGDPEAPTKSAKPAVD